jgi:hypothetical protein
MGTAPRGICRAGLPALARREQRKAEELDDLLTDSGYRVSKHWYIGYGWRYGDVVESEDLGAILVSAEAL